MEAKKYQLKSKYYYALCLGNSSKDFTINNIKKKKIGLAVIVNIFSVDFNPIDTNNIFYIHKYFMKGT